MALESWASFRLGDVCTKVGSGATPRGGSDVYLAEGPYTLIRSQNVHNEGFRRDGLVFIDERHAAELRSVEVRPGDVLLNITGDSVARCCQVDDSVLPARVNQHVAIVRPDPTKLVPQFLRYFLVSPPTQARLLSWAGSGGTRNALTKAMIESLEVFAPVSTDEQRAIAQILGVLDAKITLNRETNQTLDAMAQAIFDSWFVNFDPVRIKAGRGGSHLSARVADLFPERLADSGLGRVPAQWKVRRLGDLMMLMYGKALTERSRKAGKVPVYGSNGQVGWHDEKLASGPGVIVGRKGNPGLVVWAQADFFAIDTAFYVMPREECPSLIFLYYALRRQDLPSLAADSAVPGLNRNLVYMRPQLLPPRDVLAAFDNAVGTLHVRRHQSEEESRTLAGLRAVLLPRLVSGELLVPRVSRSNGPQG